MITKEININSHTASLFTPPHQTTKSGWIKLEEKIRVNIINVLTQHQRKLINPKRKAIPENMLLPLPKLIDR